MRFGVVGDPVLHSRSPAIHNAGFAAIGFDGLYEHIHTPSERFQSVVDGLRTGLLNGVSVTMPHKGHAFAAVDKRTDLANRTGAVNTIIAKDGTLWGTNTDVAGVTGSLRSCGASPDAPVLILGGGGAAAAALVANEERQLFVSTRDPGDAAAVLRRTGCAGGVVAWEEGVAGSVVVNATPLGMYSEVLPRSVLHVASGLLDMTYGANVTPAVAWMQGEGRPTADGVDMLVWQAYEAFTLFTGAEAPAGAMAAAARSVSG